MRRELEDVTRVKETLERQVVELSNQTNQMADLRKELADIKVFNKFILFTTYL